MTLCRDTVHARRNVQWGDQSTLFYLAEDEQQRCARAPGLVEVVLVETMCSWVTDWIYVCVYAYGERSTS